MSVKNGKIGCKTGISLSPILAICAEHFMRIVSASWKEIQSSTVISGFSEFNIIKNKQEDATDNTHEECDYYLNLFCSDRKYSKFIGFE